MSQAKEFLDRFFPGDEDISCNRLRFLRSLRQQISQTIALGMTGESGRNRTIVIRDALSGFAGLTWF